MQLKRIQQGLYGIPPLSSHGQSILFNTAKIHNSIIIKGTNAKKYELSENKEIEINPDTQYLIITLRLIALYLRE